MKNRKEQRQRRHQRLRQLVKGTSGRPRMSICKTNKNIYVQFIDDDAQDTLVAASTIKNQATINCQAAKALGQAAAEAALAKGITRIVIDRGGFQYHGCVKEIVEAAVAAGLSISDTEKTEEVSK